MLAIKTEPIDTLPPRSYNVITFGEEHMNIVHTQIVKIGNSRGVRLPKLLIEQMGFNNEVEIIVQDNQLILRPMAHSRQGWDEQFLAMAKHGDDKMLEETVSTQWDRSEWKW